MLSPMSVVSPRITCRNLKPGVGMKLYERSMHSSKPIVPWWREVWRRPRGQKLPTLMPSMWQSIPSGWHSLKQRKRYSPQYSQMVMVFSILPNRWTAQNQENCVHNDAGQLVLTSAHSMHLTILTCYIKACESENSKWHLHFSFKWCILTPKHTS